MLSTSIAILLYLNAYFEYRVNETDTSELSNILNTVYHHGFLTLWLSNPLLVGGSIILSIYLDLSLTRYSYKISQQGYSKFFKQDIYELNVNLQESIHENKPIGGEARQKYFFWILLTVGASWIFSASFAATS
ncbi:MAG: hypothetical protein ACXAC6_15200 [Candidatus Hodarchaeales archaeon]|jgi:hypothetical protein